MKSSASTISNTIDHAEQGNFLNNSSCTEQMKTISHLKRVLSPDNQEEVSCYVVFNFSKPKVEYCSVGVSKLLGFRPREFNLSNLFRLIHPDDASEYIANEFKVHEFLRQLPAWKRHKYKIQQSLRIKHASGKYIWIDQRGIVMPDQDDESLRVFFLLSKSDSNRSKKLKLSILRTRKDSFIPEQKPNLTPRELEVLSLVAENKSTKEIAEQLMRSAHTIKNHRKNILKKTGASNSLELVMLATKKGWI